MSSALQYLRLSAILAVIRMFYLIEPQEFEVGSYHNALGDNLDTLAIIGYAEVHHLTDSETLAMFCEAYTEVLNSPDGDNHPNIRAFMDVGHKGFRLKFFPLQLRPEFQISDDVSLKTEIRVKAIINDLLRL